MRGIINRFIYKVHALFIFTLCLTTIMFVCGFTFADKTSSKSDDYEWYKDYEYMIDELNKTMTINKYIGSDKEEIVYGTAIIDGIEYKTVIGLQNVEFYDEMSESKWNEDEGVWYGSVCEKITIDVSFIFPEERTLRIMIRSAMRKVKM